MKLKQNIFQRRMNSWIQYYRQKEQTKGTKLKMKTKYWKNEFRDLVLPKRNNLNEIETKNEFQDVILPKENNQIET